MKVDLDKKALISLVCGETPYYSLFGNALVRLCGNYDDNRGWSWNKRELEKRSEEELYVLYQACRNSWPSEK